MLEAEYYFLRLKNQHFNIKLKAKNWLDETVNNTQGTKNPVARELVEDFFKHLYATIKFIEAAFPDPGGVGWKDICHKLREEVDRFVLKTINEHIFAQGRDEGTQFANSFKDEDDFKKWVDTGDKMWNFLKSNKKQSTERRICDLLNHTFSAYDQLTKALNFVHNKRLEFQALLLRLILRVMKKEELISIDKFFKRTDSTNQKLKTLVKGIAKYREQNEFSHHASPQKVVLFS